MGDPSELWWWRSHTRIVGDAGDSWVMNHVGTRDSNEGDVVRTIHEQDVYLGVDVAE